MLRNAALLAIAAVASLTACTKVDDTLGSNLVPDNQQMKAGFMTIDGQLNPRKYVETRLFQTDSIISSNIASGYMGSTFNDTLGMRSVGFLSQYISYYKVDSGYFGFRPLFDSAQLILSIESYGGDTTQLQDFAVYEVISNKYLTEKPIAPGKSERDTTFYIGKFDPKKANPDGSSILGDKLFTFHLGGDKGPSTKSVTMTPTAEGRQYISRLMLQEGEYKGRYGIYSPDSLDKWVNAFKGLHICPDKDQTTPGGAIYATKLEGTALSVYGRNRVKDDPTLIKDTIGMVYYFYDTYVTTGNVSVNSARHDYAAATSPAKINLDDAKETNTNRPLNARLYVEGMGGVLSEITFTKDFFAALQERIDKENEESGKGFKTMAFSQMRMSVYFPDSDYDWEKIDPANPGKLIEQMSSAPSRLGLYTDYKKLTAIPDYAYIYEKTYGTSIAYGGYINRSRGCFVMDITGYAQQLWNSYYEQYKLANGDPDKIDWSKVEKRSIYLGPEAYSLFTASTTVLQGQTDKGETDLNNAPIKFDLAYILVK